MAVQTVGIFDSAMIAETISRQGFCLWRLSKVVGHFVGGRVTTLIRTWSSEKMVRRNIDFL
jgi:hypothetical protein